MLTQRKPAPFKEGGTVLSSRRGSIAAAVIAAGLAGAVILVFLDQYKSSVRSDAAPASVLVADRLIQKGTAGDVAGEQLVKATEVPRDQVKRGAVSDPARLRDRTAVADILPGQQITSADFTATGKGIVTRLAADQRALAIALDGPHGLTGAVGAGDRVDVIAAFGVAGKAGVRGRPVVKTLLQDVLVLSAPTAATGGEGGEGAQNVVLRVQDRFAPKLAYAAENGTLRLVLRPANGRKVDIRGLIDLDAVLFNTQPLMRRGA